MAGGGMAGGAAAGGMAGGGMMGAAPMTVGGVTFLPEPISATLTVMGTDEQLALIDSIIDQVDVRRPQAVIEVALVEIQHSQSRSVNPAMGNISLGKNVGLNLIPGTGTTALSFDRNANLPYKGGFTTRLFPSFSATLTDVMNKGKILANPTIMAMDGTESTITITDQFPNISQAITQNAGTTVVTTQIETVEAGISLTITPRIFNDGSVELTMTPDVSQPIGTVRIQDSNANDVAVTTLIASRSMELSGVRVKDGQTLVIGGLVREGNTQELKRIPGLSKLPIVSAMFRSSSTDSNRTELVLMVTPHILKEDAVTYFNSPGDTRKYNNPNQGYIQPVSLPRFMGNSSSPGKALGQAQPASPVVDAPAHKIEIDAEQPVNGASVTPSDLRQSMLTPKESLIPMRSEQSASGLKMAESSPPPAAVRRAPKRQAKATVLPSVGDTDVTLAAIEEMLKP